MKENKFVLVTGGSEGIGKAIALRLLKDQFRVCLVSRHQDKLDQVLLEAGNFSENAWTFSADLTDPNQVMQLVEEVISREGKIDVLVNNLGKGLRRELVETSDEEWDFLVRINLSSAFYVSRDVLQYMRKQNSGLIVNIASRAGRRGEGDFAAYSALKHGLVGLTRALADSEAKYGIRVNAICPGAVATERMKGAYPDIDYSGWSLPEDVAGGVAFLLSPVAANMNGQVIDLFSN